MNTDQLDSLKDLTHLDLQRLDGRHVPLHPLHDSAGWHIWIPVPQGVQKIVGTPIEMCYFAKEPASVADMRFLLLEFLHQRAYWPDVVSLAEGVLADFHNLGASLSKLKLVFDHGDRKSSLNPRMVATEIEYIFLTTRSIFDLLQEVVKHLWKRVSLFDAGVKRRDLAKSYQDMLFHSGTTQSADQIAQRYGIVKELAQIYEASMPFFTWLREYRDLISHSGKTLHYVFTTEHGFAVLKAEKPFSQMDIWCDANSLPNELGSLQSVLAHVINTMFLICDAFAQFLVTRIEFPPPIAPGYGVYVCGPHIPRLVDIAKLIQKNPWYLYDSTPDARSV